MCYRHVIWLWRGRGKQGRDRKPSSIIMGLLYTKETAVIYTGIEITCVSKNAVYALTR